MLNIFNNIIGDKGVAFISTALKTNKTLKVLFVGGSNITDEGAIVTSRSSSKQLNGVL